jgi:8-oxo-dGTP pyrophosphatase MutT (NUDIX family)
MFKRTNTGYKDGEYAIPSGHIDPGETATTAAVRETKEEIGLDISINDLQHVHTCHRVDSNRRTYFDFYFHTELKNGKPKNMEPQKHSDPEWFDLKSLPSNTMDYMLEVITHWQNNVMFSENLTID